MGEIINVFYVVFFGFDAMNKILKRAQFESSETVKYDKRILNR